VGTQAGGRADLADTRAGVLGMQDLAAKQVFCTVNVAAPRAATPANKQRQRRSKATDLYVAFPHLHHRE